MTKCPLFCHQLHGWQQRFIRTWFPCISIHKWRRKWVFSYYLFTQLWSSTFTWTISGIEDSHPALVHYTSGVMVVVVVAIFNSFSVVDPSCHYLIYFHGLKPQKSVVLRVVFFHCINFVKNTSSVLCRPNIKQSAKWRKQQTRWFCASNKKVSSQPSLTRVEWVSLF